MMQPSKETEEEIKNLIFSNTSVFKAPCRLHNWNEDLFLKEEKTAVAIYKKERCQLLLQKTRRMFKNLLKPTKLSHSLEMLKFGELYQIVAPLIPSNTTKSGVRPIYLAGLVTEQQVKDSPNFIHGSPIVGSLIDSPCSRNTFRIIGFEGPRIGEIINYGDDVCFQIADTNENSSEKPLRVHCDNNFYQLGHHLLPKLSECFDTYCRFKIIHCDPNLRFETEGSTIRANDKVVIQHVPTGKNLAVENIKKPSFFGDEYVISCHTFRDIHKIETAQNIWKIVGKALPNKNAVVRAAMGEEIPDEWIQ